MKWRRIALIAVASWLLTQFVGVRQVEKTAIGTMPAFVKSFTRVSRENSHQVVTRHYYCRAIAYAPFLIRADYGWWEGHDVGEGTTAFYLWIFGISIRLREFTDWLA